MRRALPWALVGLVGFVTAAAAALGAVAAPGTQTVTPAQWVAGVLSTTAQAGTAHFTYDLVTTSPNPELRSTRHGGGVVDFSQGNVQVQEIDHEVEFESGSSGPMHPVPSSTTQEQISVGRVTYERVFPTGLGRELTIRAFGFRKVPFARASRADLGLSFALGADAALAGLDGSRPVVAVRDLGTTTVDRQPTTAYLVLTAPRRSAPPRARRHRWRRKAHLCSGSTARDVCSESAARGGSAASCLPPHGGCPRSPGSRPGPSPRPPR